MENNVIFIQLLKHFQMVLKKQKEQKYMKMSKVVLENRF